MPRLLIVYGTTDGQTAKIARFMADVAARQGRLTVVRDARDLPADVALDGYDAALLGASVHSDGFQTCVRAH